MTAVLLTVVLFGAFWLIGLAALVVLGIDVATPRVAMAAPAFGVAVTALATFLISYAGAGTGSFAVPLVCVLLVASSAVVAVRRPPVPATALLVAGIAVVGFLIAATPMFSLGFRWIANANDDMANYSLSAQQLIHHGLTTPADLVGLLQGRDYPTVLTTLHRLGSRPGSDLLLSVVSVLTGRASYEVFMPVTFAFAMAGICAAGALAAQDVRRRWAAPVAATLLVISPLATYGVLQQLIAQAFGLAVGVAFLAFILRPSVHRERVPVRSEIVPIGVLLAGVILGYVELASTLALAYLLYVALLAWRRELNPRAVLRLWLGAAVVALVLLNGYLPSEINYLVGQAKYGASISGHPPLFGYTLIPSALPTLLGFQTLATPTSAPLLGFSIALALVLLLAALLASLHEARRGSAVAAVLVADAVLAVYLAAHSADFGLFKLGMYMQPLFAAGLALLVVRLRRRYLPLAAAVLVLLAVVQLSTQQLYVEGSRHPGDFRNASAADLLPRARSAIDSARGPTIIVGDNPVYIGLTAINAYGHRVYFLSRDTFSPFVAAPEAALLRRSKHSHAARLMRTVGPRTARFVTYTAQPASDAFTVNPGVNSSFAENSCRLVMPTGEQGPYNRLWLPEDRHDLAVMPCRSAHDLLAFVDSRLGQSFYLPTHPNFVSFYELQPDYYFPTRTMAGLGQYALFRVLGPTAGMRLEINYTFSFIHNGSNAIPHSVVVGARRAPLPVVGRGSARVISPPITPQIIDGEPYLLVDVGQRARISYDRRRGLDALFGTSVPMDTRRLTGYVRDISLLSAADYARLQPPLAVSSFPTALGNPDLEYSGVYEDGWVADDSYFVLAGGKAATFELKASVPAGAAHHLEILLNGRRLSELNVSAGPLSVSLPVGASSGTRRVELRFDGSIRLPAPDYRPTSALLSYVGFVRRP